jgi:hypothetical protein
LACLSPLDLGRGRRDALRDGTREPAHGIRRSRRGPKRAVGECDPVRAVSLSLIVAVTALAVAFRFVQIDDPVGAPTIDATNVDRLALAWQRDISGGGSSRAVVADGTIYAASDDGALRAIDARTGEIKWVGPTALGAPTSPVVAAGSVFLHVGGRLYAFAIDCASGGATCTSQWNARTGGTDRVCHGGLL